MVARQLELSRCVCDLKQGQKNIQSRWSTFHSVGSAARLVCMNSHRSFNLQCVVHLTITINKLGNKLGRPRRDRERAIKVGPRSHLPYTDSAH